MHVFSDRLLEGPGHIVKWVAGDTVQNRPPVVICQQLSDQTSGGTAGFAGTSASHELPPPQQI